MQKKTMISDIFPGSTKRLIFNTMAGYFYTIRVLAGSNIMVDTLEAYVSNHGSMPDFDVFVGSFSVYGLHVMAMMALTLCNLRESKADDAFPLSRIASMGFLSDLRTMFRLLSDPARASVHTKLLDLQDVLGMPANVFDDDAAFSITRKKVFSYMQMKKLYLVFYTVGCHSLNYQHTVSV